jgi:hypothetical protein
MVGTHIGPADVLLQYEFWQQSDRLPNGAGKNYGRAVLGTIQFQKTSADWMRS